jgi:hypothetical protein
MFTSNPWAFYTGTISAALLIYYAFVCWKFYRNDLRILLGGPKSKRQGPDFAAGPPTSEQKELAATSVDEELLVEEEPPAWQNEELFTQVENLFEHLASEIEEAHQKNYNRQDLIQMLQLILKEYQVLKGTPFQFAVNNRIDVECAKYGSIHLREGDKGEVWRMV